MDRPIQQIAAQSLTDEFGHEPEITDFNVRRGAAIQLGIAGRHGAEPEHVHLDARIDQDGGEPGIVEPPAIGPAPGLAHRGIDIPIERDGGALCPADFEVRTRRRPRPLRRRRPHLEIGDDRLERVVVGRDGRIGVAHVSTGVSLRPPHSLHEPS